MYNGLFYSQRRNGQPNRGMRTNANAGTRQQPGCNNRSFVPNNFQENKFSNQTTNQSSCKSTNQSSCGSTNQSSCRPTNQSSCRSTNQPSCRSTNQSSCGSTNQSSCQLSNHSSSHSENHKEECCGKLVKEIRIEKCQDQPSCISDDVFLKASAFGGVIIEDGTEKGTTYNVVSVNLDTAACRHFHTELSFSCNIICIDASARLKFQILKQEKNQMMPLPLSSGNSYSRNQKVTESNVVTFSALDCDSHGTQWCNYSVFIEIMGQQTAGTVIITNPVLIAVVVEKNQGNMLKGDIHDQTDK